MTKMTDHGQTQVQSSTNAGEIVSSPVRGQKKPFFSYLPVTRMYIADHEGVPARQMRGSCATWTRFEESRLSVIDSVLACLLSRRPGTRSRPIFLTFTLASDTSPHMIDILCSLAEMQTIDSCNIFGSRCGTFTGVEKLHQSLVWSSVPQHGRPFVFWMSGRWPLRFDFVQGLQPGTICQCRVTYRQ